MRNTGIEFTVSAIPVKNSDFQWNIDFNADFRKKRITVTFQ